MLLIGGWKSPSRSATPMSTVPASRQRVPCLSSRNGLRLAPAMTAPPLLVPSLTVSVFLRLSSLQLRFHFLLYDFRLLCMTWAPSCHCHGFLVPFMSQKQLLVSDCLWQENPHACWASEWPAVATPTVFCTMRGQSTSLLSFHQFLFPIAMKALKNSIIHQSTRLLAHLWNYSLVYAFIHQFGDKL